MKTIVMWKRSLGVAFALLPLLGCGQKSQPAGPVIVQNTAPVVGLTPSFSETTLVTNSPLLTNVGAPAAFDVAEEGSVPDAAGPNLEEAATEVVTPPTILSDRISPAASEIVKLAQAGVDANVMMAFVTNSTNVFRLSSDNLVYLNDVGVPPEVVTAMIQRDHAAGVPAVALPEEAEFENEPAQAAGAPVPYETYTANVPASSSVPAAPVVEAPAQSQVNVSYTYFYDSLAPYGTWVNVQGYGLCWRPTVAVSSGWQPYVNGGRWMYTDVGWYWVSDYSWGWAPFHYGRWFRHSRIGWCWAPDTVWGPSWVSWRYGGDYCGWAPLPPAAGYHHGVGLTYYGRSVGFSFGFGLSSSYYCFVPTRHFHDRHFHRHRIPHHRVDDFYRHSRPIHRYDRDERNRVVNRGIPVEEVRTRSGAPIRPVTIREVDRPMPARLERGSRENNPRLAVFRPDLPQPDRPGRLVGEGVRPAPSRNIVRNAAETRATVRGERPEAGANRNAVTPLPNRNEVRGDRVPQRNTPDQVNSPRVNSPAVAAPEGDRDVRPRVTRENTPGRDARTPTGGRGDRPAQGAPAEVAAPGRSETPREPVRLPQRGDAQPRVVTREGRPAAAVQQPAVQPGVDQRVVQPRPNPVQPTESPTVTTPNRVVRQPAPRQAAPQVRTLPTPARPQVAEPRANPAPPVVRVPPREATPQANSALNNPVMRQPAPRQFPQVQQPAPAVAPRLNAPQRVEPPVVRSSPPVVNSPQIVVPPSRPSYEPRRIEQQPRMVAPRVEQPSRSFEPPPQVRSMPREEARPQAPSVQPRSAPSQPAGRGGGAEPRRNR